MLKGFFNLFVFLLLTLNLSGQITNLSPENAVWNGPVSDTIPVELAHGSIIITLSVEGRRCRFIFDTGAPFSISETLNAQNNFDSVGTQIIRDATGHIDSLENVLVPLLAIGKLTVKNSKADVLDYQKSSFFSCLNIDGLIGGDIFKTCLIEIDLKNKRLIIFPGKKSHALTGNESPVNFDEQYNPEFELRLNESFALKVLFDTGAEDLLTIPEESYNRARHVCPFKQLRNGKYSLAGAHNITVSDDYRIVTTDSLQICHARIKSPEICVSAGIDISILGMDILHYGIIRLDYSSSTIGFTPYLADIVFTKKENFPGFSVGRENQIYVINGLESGSAAAINGLDVGMQVIRIGDINLESYSPRKDCRILRKNLSGLKRITIEYIDHHRRRKTVTLKRLTKMHKA